jgi:hypothetical protein
MDGRDKNCFYRIYQLHLGEFYNIDKQAIYSGQAYNKMLK